jgi:hypothetical protein
MAVREVREECPGVFCILTSWGAELGEAAMASPPRADMYIPKDKFIPGTADWDSYKTTFKDSMRMDLRAAAIDSAGPLNAARASKGEVSDILLNGNLKRSSGKSFSVNFLVMRALRKTRSN